MPKNILLLFTITLCGLSYVLCKGFGSGNNGNLRVCVVEGKGTYRRSGKFCPILDEEKSGVECVLATDRMDCLRRMSKGTVDFGVFSPEDLMAAQWAQLDVLVTNELRLRDRDYEKSIVAVINRRIYQSESSVGTLLRNTTLCHPGIGGDDFRGLSDTLAQYLESLLTERSCDPNLSLEENRLNAISRFFRSACKAGPWVADQKRDAELKSRYPSLCAACDSGCAVTDHYWGISGALVCLTDGAGDVTWATTDHVQAYFGLTGQSVAYASKDTYAYLCRDGSIQNLNTTEPCVWLRRPWPAVVAKRRAAEAVSTLAANLLDSASVVDGHWREALMSLLETNQALGRTLQPQRPPLDYLSMATGFREAYSQSGCSPPRHITLCTTSVIAKHKCDWLSESGAVYGVSPPLQCVMRASENACFAAVRDGECDATIASSDWLLKALRDYNITAVLHQTTPIVEKLRTVTAYVSKDSGITKMAHLRGKRAAFPRFDGVAWHSVLQDLLNTSQIANCNLRSVAGYFSEVCAPGVGEMGSDPKLGDCYKVDSNTGDLEALRSLAEGRSDVAYLNMETYKMYRDKQIPESWATKGKEIVPLCQENDKYCIISWTSLGNVYISINSTAMKRQEVINVFKKLDQLFGRYYPFHTAMFSMYGAFNHQLDVLFNNSTKNLLTDEQLKMAPYNRFPVSFEERLATYDFRKCGNTACSVLPRLTLIALVLCFLFR